MKILIVDDHDKMRIWVRSVIDTFGIGPNEYTECRNGEEAVAAFLLVRPDAVVMDISMPVMDGLMATRKIVDADPQSKIVLFTQLPVEEYVEAAARARAHSIISKEDLLKLREVLVSFCIVPNDSTRKR
ncbi:MAG: response regulator transcription factor [Bacteroidetes bacterium]|nr:response regulator transcription factor [Bacteroidota bacterium]